MKFILASIACLIGVSNAWFLGRNLPTVEAVGDVNPACQVLGQAGSCEFYECFEDRLPCGQRGYMEKYGLFYCHSIALQYNRFTPEGKRWVNETGRCLTQKLMTNYTRSSVNCDALARYAFDTWDDCFIQAGLCDVFWENVEVFRHIYSVRHLFDTQGSKVWRELFQIVMGCGNQRIQERGGISGMFDRIESAGSRLGDLLGLK